MADSAQFQPLNDRDPDGNKDVSAKHSYPDGGSYDELFNGTSSSQLTSAGTLMVTDFYWTFQDIQFYSDWSFFFAMLGIGLMMTAKELRFHGDPNSATNNLVVFILRSLQSLSTACLIYCTFCYYRADWRFVQLNRQFLKQIKVWTSDRIFSFVLEVLICLVHEPPFYDMDMDVSLPLAEWSYGPVYLRNPFALIMFIRVYLVVRLVLTRCTILLLFLFLCLVRR